MLYDFIPYVFNYLLFGILALFPCLQKYTRLKMFQTVRPQHVFSRIFHVNLFIFNIFFARYFSCVHYVYVFVLSLRYLNNFVTLFV